MSPPDLDRAPPALRLARRYSRWKLATEVDGLHAAGMESLRELLTDRAAILAPNHAAWWDPLVLVTADEASGADGTVLMEAGNLRRFPFFGRLGALPLDRAHPREGLRAAARRLETVGRAVWIFPQGRERPPHLRPLRFKGGVSLLAAMVSSKVAVVPVGLQYAFGEAHRPAAYLSFGPPIPARRIAEPDGVDRLEAGVIAELERIDEHLDEPSPAFGAIVDSRVRRPDERLGPRVLSRLTRSS